jgi:hypothetical protein
MNRGAALGALVALGVIVVLAAASLGCQQRSVHLAAAPTSLPEIAAPTALPATSGDSPEATSPTLTDEQRQQVIDIAVRDTHLKQLVGDRPLTVMGVYEWADGTGQLIGGVATLRLAQPSTLEGEWLGAVWDADQKAYNIVPYQAKYSEVTSLTAMVDLRNGGVAELKPDHAARPEGTPEALAPPRLLHRSGA